ncbi:hypothetical protein BDV27DRAFT_169851 [Aspergillus caelatus]|uniref:P-loop containing nucleoside triphosphate hydrolase protein n=1 Tax=Aspergillus caelatus TaxID=61420 RepID=A0A5N6ZLD5_9EURO|nr:uncharacterized protein BDV27DRAFT_169851 [Aspergillus caelatus]KAE8358023.1 hypothetical protein BDV27DRAFT_169851 [Aspergillus caelatus]
MSDTTLIDCARICFDFARTGSCKFKNCRYSHEAGPSKPAAKGNNSRSSARRQQPSHRTNDINGLAAWKRKAPKSRLAIPPLGAELGQFFATARRLIEVDDDSTAQEVIQCLSHEGGLQRIQELIQRDYCLMPNVTKRDVFQKQFLPFLESITHHKVLASLVMEEFVVKIYNCIYGPAGHRAEPFLNFLADVVQLDVELHSDATSTYLELALLVFCKIIELNSTAFIQESLKPVARRLYDLFMILHALEAAGSLDRPRHHLEVLQRQLEIGSALPPLLGNSIPRQAHKSPVAFVTLKDPPGGRHDNDHADICRIKIMPTFQEIMSPRSEYLPGKDPQQWHIGGLGGLLDRNFRLLREDTIGQLRDVIHAELRPSRLRDVQKSQVRTNVYQDVQVRGLDFDRLTGFQFVVQFAQPLNVRSMSEAHRREWWELSKRLQSSALVCLTDLRGFAIFCTVAGPERPRMDVRQKPRQRKVSSLFKEARGASVTMELVEPTEENRQYILDCYRPRNGGRALSLIEFPGILLPSFQPTLKALQSMKKAADLPMSEFLAPDEMLTGLVDMPPPKYAAVPGFSFNLCCLMDDRSDLLVSPSQPLDMEKLQKKSTLDDAQAQALVHTLQRKIGLIQGPPGTGKSYTGVALINVLLANKAKVKPQLGPIICVCYTNHALDQLLEDLLDNEITTQIIRIGSQSKSEKLQPLNLRTVVRQIDKTRLEKEEQWKLQVNFDDYENSFDALKLDAIGTDRSLEFHLKRNHPRQFSQLFGKDEHDFQKASGRRRQHLLQTWLRSGPATKGQPRAVDVLHQVHLDNMTSKERRILHNHWIRESRQDLHTQAHSILASHQENKASYDRIRDELDLRCLRNADVIGVTTTGLARNLNMLRRLQSKVIICEEAGEVLEAHLLSSLLPSAEQVILIGDHQQLRPQIQNYGLSRESRTGQQYSLDRSLFERLVEPDDDVGIRLPFSTLETQRRMHPSIAQLDAPSVSQLFWLDHRRPEGNPSIQDAMATSHWNDHEIEMTSTLVNHLLRQGTYQAGDIAVLTPYLGQLHRMRRKLSQAFTITLGERDQDDLDKAGFTEDERPTPPSAVSRSTLLQALRVATIDNFQGEEAKVVVISLVRSNGQNRCGFLRTPNRINVLLSRAQHGMGVNMWHKVLSILEEHDNFGTGLELKCPRHPSTPITVSQPDDFVQFSPEGGCSLRCGKRLQCEILHQTKGCSHPCPKVCGDACPKRCGIMVFDADRVLPCAQDLSLVKCPIFVKKHVPYCNHEITIACHIDVSKPEYKCTRQCHAALPCGHNCKRQCSQCMIQTNEKIKADHGPCKQRCDRLYSTCAHTCAGECHGGDPCPPCTAPCDVQCGHSRCSQKCSEPCAPCAVSKCLSACPHSAYSMPCAAPCDYIPCSRRCEKVLPCGHQCPSLCGEPCPAEKFCQTCATDAIKDISVDFILGQTYKEIDLDENPCIFPPCGHFLTVENMDAQMDLGKHYVVDEMGKPISISKSSEPFSISDVRNCATCRGSLRSISRYGRLVRRALLDEATKKFILYVNQQYVQMTQKLAQFIAQLPEHEGTAVAKAFQNELALKVQGPPDHQIQLMHQQLRKYDTTRWKDLILLRHQITEYYNKVKVEEQPFNQVRNMVEDARRRKRKTGQFEFDESVLQTKGCVQAASLLLRLDTALIGDFLSLYKQTPSKSNKCVLQLDLQANRKEGERLTAMAVNSQRVLHQVEGYLFRAQLCALERQSSGQPTRAEDLLEEGNECIERAQKLCTAHPGQVRGLADEIEGTSKMLRGGTFYTPVTSEERMAVVAAMAREFRGTGHWYRCENNHPFTIGDCGGAMEISTCPECGARVGGQHHRTLAGVTRADELEVNLARLMI